AAIIFNAFGLFYGVMVAFVVFVTWSGYSEATKNLEMEANEVADIFHSTQAFPDPVRTAVRQALIDYTTAAYDELNRMSRGEIGHLVGFHLQIFCGFGISAPRNKYDKGHHYSVKQAEGVENDCRYLVVLL